MIRAVHPAHRNYRQPRSLTMLKKTRMGVAAMCGIAALALVVIAGGVTYAATNGAPATITVCVHHSGGGLYKASKCAAHDSSLTWNVKGPAGAPGAAGLSLFVRADETGKMYQHSAGVTVQRYDGFTGVYLVVFKQNISKCAAVVSQGEASNNGFFPGTFYEAVVQSDKYNLGNPHEVLVYATNASGDAVKAGFDLILAC
jgi:hypothetical protein